MSSKVTMQIEGVQKTLAELNKFDKVYRRQVTKDIKGAGTPINASLGELSTITLTFTGGTLTKAVA